jgi:alkanesulfonate monooxygenase SsuD/methylene tetrahydromethanopterin reductase-like flavin-dependent oxidoreductase (luciferase family)
VKFGIDLPTVGPYADVRLLTSLARDAEAVGWDGFFVYDQVAPEDGAPLVDPWIALTAIALATERLYFGPLVTPLARRRPWKVARETVTLDHLSGGRLILGVGLGGTPSEFDDLGEAAPTVRAAMLDEALEVLAALWSGEPVSHGGRHYAVRTAGFRPRPVQVSRIPIWVGGTWPLKAPFRRAARWDGAFPHYRDGSGYPMMPLEAVRDILAFVAGQRAKTAPFDVVVRNKAPSGDNARDAATAAAYAGAGVTWWLEGVEGRDSAEAMQARIRQGPPRL